MDGTAFDVSRPMHLSADGRYFLDGRDAPFYWLGDTAWPLFTSYSQDEAAAFLEDRARKGFTVIQAVLAFGGGTSMEAALPFANPDGERPWHDSPATPNAAYFRYVDALLELARTHGLTLALVPVWGYYITDAGAFTAESAYAYGRWLGERYRQTPNLVWMNGGDRTPEHHRDIFRAQAAGLRAGDGGAHLITYHPHAWRSSSQYFDGDERLDFEMIQTWREWAMVHPAVLADVVRHPARPVVLAEGAYEAGTEYNIGSFITPHQVRCQAWWTATAGGYFTYGHRQMWVLDPGWLATKDAPGAQAMTVLRDVMTALPWWRMYPDQSLIFSGVSSGHTLNTALRADDGSRALLYLSTPCTLSVALHRLNHRQVRATYINPQTADRLDAGEHLTGNNDPTAPYPAVTKLQAFATPDGWEDAVLVLEGVE